MSYYCKCSVTLPHGDICILKGLDKEIVMLFCSKYVMVTSPKSLGVNFFHCSCVFMDKCYNFFCKNGTKFTFGSWVLLSEDFRAIGGSFNKSQSFMILQQNSSVKCVF